MWHQPRYRQIGTKTLKKDVKQDAFKIRNSSYTYQGAGILELPFGEGATSDQDTSVT